VFGVAAAVQCNSFDNVGQNGTTCLTNGGEAGGTIRGITHMRYDCTDHRVWLLTYVVPGTDLLEDKPGDMWVQTACNDTEGYPSVCHGSKSQKTFKFGTTSGSCEIAVTDCGTGICCLNMWPVYDVKVVNGGSTNVQVGYLAKGSSALNNQNAAWDTLLVHWKWQDAGSNDNTGSSSAYTVNSGNGICLPGICQLWR
jgi:hypothetical protein